MGLDTKPLPENKQYDFSKDTPENRDHLLALLGETVKVVHTIDNVKCGLIGWLFRVGIDIIQLKITSTRNETYSAEPVEIETIDSISAMDYSH